MCLQKGNFLKENKNYGSSVIYCGSTGKFMLRDRLAKLLNQKTIADIQTKPSDQRFFSLG